MTRPSLSVTLLALLFAGAGVMHFARPDAYVRIVPAWLPSPRLLVQVSGACELLGGIGVLLPRVRVAAGWGLLALLVAVFPANVQMWQSARATGASSLWQAALLLRLPLQGALMYWVYRAAVRSPA